MNWIIHLQKKSNSHKSNAEELVNKGKRKYDDAKKDAKNAAANLNHDVETDFNHATS